MYTLRKFDQGHKLTNLKNKNVHVWDNNFGYNDKDKLIGQSFIGFALFHPRKHFLVSVSNVVRQSNSILGPEWKIATNSLVKPNYILIITDLFIFSKTQPRKVCKKKLF